MSARVLLIGAGAAEASLSRFLAGQDGVGRIHLSPGRGGLGNPRTQRTGLDPMDTEGLASYSRRRRIDLVIEGPDAAGVADLLRARSSYKLHGPGTQTPLPRAVWRLLRRRSLLSRWRVATPPAPADPHPSYRRARYACERDHAYTFKISSS